MPTGKLQIVPLGGLGEFGMNCMAVRWGDHIVVIDAGLMFPESELLGVDIVVPDITYLVENRSKVRAILLTHDSLAEPSIGHYHREARKAKSELACLRYKQGKVCFYGHTHRVRAEIANAEGNIVLPMFTPHLGKDSDPKPLRLRENEIAWIGTGSVGFPGNEKRGAECLMLDDSEWRIEAYAVEYDRQAARARTREILAGPCGSEVAEHIARWM
jgi:hypothetical protein